MFCQRLRSRLATIRTVSSQWSETAAGNTTYDSSVDNERSSGRKLSASASNLHLKQTLLTGATMLGAILLIAGFVLLIFSTTRVSRSGSKDLKDIPPPVVVPQSESEPGPGPGIERPKNPRPQDIKSFTQLRLYYANKIDVNCGLRHAAKWEADPRLEELPGFFHSARVNRTQQPWYVEMWNEISNRFEFSCGGVLIARDLILTTRECGYELPDYAVGGHFLGPDLARHHNGLIKRVDKLYTPEGYFERDELALLKLKEGGFEVPVLDLNGRIVVNTICLPPPPGATGLRPDVVHFPGSSQNLYELVGDDPQLSKTPLFQTRLAGDSVREVCPGLDPEVYNRTTRPHQEFSVCRPALRPVCRYGTYGSPLYYIARQFDPKSGSAADVQYRAYVEGHLFGILPNKTDPRDDPRRCDESGGKMAAIFQNVTTIADWLADRWWKGY